MMAKSIYGVEEKRTVAAIFIHKTKRGPAKWVKGGGENQVISVCEHGLFLKEKCQLGLHAA